jgi:multicomponent Na+:H+ antiporter subunit D
MMLALPILFPFGLAILLLALKKSAKYLKITSILGTVGVFIISIFLLAGVKQDGIQVMYAGGWKAPYGIPLVIDLFSGIMLVITGIIAVCVGIFSIKQIDNQRHIFHFNFFMHTLLMGVNGSYITGDIFNLFVWFEVMLISSFALLSLGNEKRQLRGSVKYITINMVSSFLLLAGIGLIYGITGTLNMADLSMIMNSGDIPPPLTATMMLLFISLAIKAALFPFFFWLPASYHTPPVAVTALFSALLSKVAVYVLIRFFTLFFDHLDILWSNLLLIIAGFTMLTGVLAAAAQMDIRKILSFHIISQIGYMIMGLGLFTKLAIAGSIYFIAHNIFAKTNTFFIGGLVNKLQSSFNLRNTGNLLNTNPLLALLFFIPAMALAGLPPLSGFFGKFILIQASFESEEYTVAIVALVVSILTLYSMLKIWNKAFLKKQEEAGNPDRKSLDFVEILPSVILGGITILMGIAAAYVFDLCFEAAEQLMNNENYIKMVLGKQ